MSDQIWSGTRRHTQPWFRRLHNISYRLQLNVDAAIRSEIAES